MSTSTTKLNGVDGVWYFLGILLVANLALFTSGMTRAFVYVPDLVAKGEWWRLVLHPFVHVSLYHLALDGLAFAFLYYSLVERRATRRVSYVVATALGSALAATVAAPSIQWSGLCGLSGVAHGLMAVSAIECIRLGLDQGKSMTLWIGIGSLVAVVGKSVIEAWTGDVMFMALHIGNVGSPLAVCHAGGTLAGILAYVGFYAWDGSARYGRRVTRAVVPSHLSADIVGSSRA